MRLSICVLSLFLGFAFLWAEPERASIPWRKDGFNPEILLKKDSYLPENFSINHLFSMGVIGYSSGGSRSGGTYLSLMRYDISPSLSLSAAIGFSMLFHSSMQENHPDVFREETMQPILRIPYVALNYRISETANFRLQIGDGSSYWDSCRSHCRYSYGRLKRRPIIERQ